MYELADAFADSVAELKLPAICPPFEIHVTGKPIHQRYYRLAPDDSKLVYGEVQEMLQGGIITPSSGPWSSPCFVAHC
jgi:RNase H-like domain found in reverse transcriptase/Reverse transcriptase (RNA-dependent DNA polymerase)